MTDDMRGAEANPETSQAFDSGEAYEAPQIWEYGSLRIATAGLNFPSNFDGINNFS